MKTKSLFLAALVVFSSAVAFAGKEEPRNTGLAVVPVKGTEIFKVIYKGESAGRVKLNIYDASGSLIMTERISTQNGFMVPVNFNGLSSGNYTVELIDGTGTKIEKIAYKASSTKTEKVSARSVVRNLHISRLTNDRSRFLVSIPKSTANENVTVRIYDAQDNLIHTQTTEINSDLGIVYKVPSAKAAYTFEVKDSSGETRVIRF